MTERNYVNMYGREIKVRNYSLSDNFDDLIRPYPEVSFSYEKDLNIFGIIMVGENSATQKANDTSEGDSNEGDTTQEEINSSTSDFRPLPFKRKNLRARRARRTTRYARQMQNNKSTKFLIQIYDNSNWNLIKRISFNSGKKNSFINSYQLYMDLDYLIIIDLKEQIFQK